jgi:hypothetical protein
MMVVVQLLLVVVFVTLIKLGTRRLFRGRGRDAGEVGDIGGETTVAPTVDTAPRAKPKPTSRTNGPRRR